MALLRKLTGEQRRTIAHWAMELLIVVAGVLIALWLQQWGERRRAIADMKAAEASIREEVRSSLESLIWRQAVSQCHFDRAELLKNMLMKGAHTWPGVSENTLVRDDLSQATGIQLAMPGVYGRPSDSFTMAAWTSALATGALAPMDRGRFTRLANLYDLIEFLGSNRDREDRAASILSALTVPQEITAESRTRMFQALYEVDTSRFMFNYTLPDFVGAMQELGWADKAEIDKFIRNDQRTGSEFAKLWRPCVKLMLNPLATPAKD